MEEWKTRMLSEYNELKTRLHKLHAMIVKYEAGTLDFTPNCPIEILKRQERIMEDYLCILQIRGEIEHIDLDVQE